MVHIAISNILLRFLIISFKIKCDSTIIVFMRKNFGCVSLNSIQQTLIYKLQLQHLAIPFPLQIHYLDY
jgi:hypothetical protein